MMFEISVKKNNFNFCVSKIRKMLGCRVYKEIQSILIKKAVPIEKNLVLSLYPSISFIYSTFPNL